jgi:hypothetical protein
MKLSKSNKSLYARILDWFSCWLTCDIEPTPEVLPIDFSSILQQITPADVILIEGRSRVSRVISFITKSSWTHAGLYIGCLSKMKDSRLIDTVHTHYDGDADEHLIIESLPEKGVIISPISTYKNYNMRICRPKNLPENDANKAITYAVKRVKFPYDKQQIFDLARFLFPWFLLPRKWHSSLFAYKAGESTKLSCSLLVAEAFISIRYPILPIVRKDPIKGYIFVPRNPRLFTPRDFDYSPFFDVIKHPIIEFTNDVPYTKISWEDDRKGETSEGDSLEVGV